MSKIVRAIAWQSAFNVLTRLLKSIYTVNWWTLNCIIIQCIAIKIEGIILIYRCWLTISRGKFPFEFTAYAIVWIKGNENLLYVCLYEYAIYSSQQKTAIKREVWIIVSSFCLLWHEFVKRNDLEQIDWPNYQRSRVNNHLTLKAKRIGTWFRF